MENADLSVFQREKRDAKHLPLRFSALPVHTKEAMNVSASFVSVAHAGQRKRSAENNIYAIKCLTRQPRGS